MFGAALENPPRPTLFWVTVGAFGAACLLLFIDRYTNRLWPWNR